MLTADQEHQASLPQADPQHPGYFHLSVPVWKHRLYQVEHYFSLLWEKTVIILLLIASGHTLYLSVKFLFFEYPELDQKLQASILTTDELRLILAQSIGLMIATILGLMLAIRLSKQQAKLFRYLEMVLGTALVIRHDEFVIFLQSYDYTAAAVRVQEMLGMPPIW